MTFHHMNDFYKIAINIINLLMRTSLIKRNNSVNFSASGCPIAARNKMRILESGGTIEQHKAAIAAAQAAAAAMKYDGSTCTLTDGDGHMSAAFLTQR